MITRKILYFWMLCFLAFRTLSADSLAKEFRERGYIEICNEIHGTDTFDSLYACFDELVEFLQSHPDWVRKLYCAKERFIRTKNRQCYSANFFGFYDESEKVGRSQVCFYYASHFHEYISLNYPEIIHVPEIMGFLEACHEIQKPYGRIFEDAARELGVNSIFSSVNEQPPILLKIIKYFPSYSATRPHYDGTAFSLFLDSTDNQSLLISPYKDAFTVSDFIAPVRDFPRESDRNTNLLIPGGLLAEFSIYPTPHIVAKSGKIRYAAIAFAMRPNFTLQKNEFSLLPDFEVTSVYTKF